MTDESENNEKQLKKKPFWASKNILYVMGLPFPATIQEIKNFFIDCGEIGTITRQLNENGRWNGCVFVKFQNKTDMEKALTLNGSIWTGTGSDGTRYIKIQEHKGKEKKKKKKDEITTVFVGNLPKEINDDEFRNLFSSCGEIKSIRYALDSQKQCRGFCHIEFRSVESRDQAIALNRKIFLCEKPLTVRLATITTSAEQKKKNQRTEAKKARQKEKHQEKKKRARIEREGDNREEQDSQSSKKKKQREEPQLQSTDNVGQG